MNIRLIRPEQGWRYTNKPSAPLRRLWIKPHSISSVRRIPIIPGRGHVGIECRIRATFAGYIGLPMERDAPLLSGRRVVLTAEEKQLSCSFGRSIAIFTRRAESLRQRADRSYEYQTGTRGTIVGEKGRNGAEEQVKRSGRKPDARSDVRIICLD